MKKTTACLVLILTALVAAPLAAQHGGEGGGESGGGCGDVFGDLIHLKRDAVTGQPILAQRWIDLPKELPYGWGYCPIAVDKNGQEIPFVALSCDPVDSAGTAVVPVDYFGRLSGGRTKERNSRMHFNEVISSIKMAGGVRLDETGRLQLGYTCTSPTQCAEWGVIDSPMENMALYTRLMKYGHFQTDPAEVDTWAHGDPTADTQYNPALDSTVDWPKFQASVRHLLPANVSTFSPESLTAEDFVSAGAALGGAANKTGKITVDLVQYMNRILKITKKTEASEATLDWLPAKVRDCWTSDVAPVLATDTLGEVLPIDPVYDLTCSENDANSALDNYLLFPDVQERFVDFSVATYGRVATWGTRRAALIRPMIPALPLTFYVDNRVAPIGWLNFIDPNLEPAATSTAS